MTYRLIATDLDGTLLHSDGTVSARTVKMLQMAEAAGVAVVIATARPLRWMRPLADTLNHTGIAVLANGALVYDLHTDTMITARPLSAEVVRKIAEIVRASVPGVTFAVESAASGFGQEPHYTTHHDDTKADARIAPISSLVTDDVIKLLVQHQAMSPDALLAATTDVAGGLAEFTHSSRGGLLEVSATGVTKASTLAQIAEQRGIAPTNVIAFGDMPNDLQMLAWAGTSYAMANAHPDVLAAAQHIAPSNDEDGVAQIIADRLDFKPT
jgi:hypothetical protein